MRTIRVDNQAIFSASNTARSSSRLPLTLDFAPVKQIFHDTRSHQEDHLQVQKKPIHCTLLWIWADWGTLALTLGAGLSAGVSTQS